MTAGTPPLSADDVVAAVSPAGLRLLEVGCGDGQVGAALLQAGAAEVVGLDPCARGLTRSRLTAVFRLAADAAPELPYPEGYFDAVVVEDLSALQAPAEALAHLRRWLAPGGRLVAVAPNAIHEAALVALLGEGRWPDGAGRRPGTVGAAIEALGQAGFVVEDEATAIRTEPGPAADVLRRLAEALGADGEQRRRDLTLVRAILTARPAAPGAAAPGPLADPWAGSRPVRVLLTPDLGQAGDGWLEAVAGLAAGLSGNAAVTLGLALPAALVRSPPQSLQAAVGEATVDLLLTEAPHDADGWERLLAGAGTWVVTAPRPELMALARRVGVDVQRGA